MRSTAEIVQFIDSWIGRALDRPEMYAATPESLEEELRTLDQVRHFALSPPPAPSVADLPYHRFLGDRGFGTALFTYRQDPVAPAEKRFADLAHFWRQYLASSYRLPASETVG